MTETQFCYCPVHYPQLPRPLENLCNRKTMHPFKQFTKNTHRNQTSKVNYEYNTADKGIDTNIKTMYSNIIITV